MPGFCGIGYKIKAFFRRPTAATEASRPQGRKSNLPGYEEGTGEIVLPELAPELNYTGPIAPVHPPTPAGPPQLTFTPPLSPQLPPPQVERLASSSIPSPQSGSSNFPNAHDFSISKLSIDNSSHIVASKVLFDYLEPYISHGAAHDSDERCDAPKCAPETREAVQGDIFSFISQGDGELKKLMWLGGPAGSGKTAITGSVAEACKRDGILAASFFFSSFSGSADRYSKRCVVATLAHHLATHHRLKEYKFQLQTAIESQPDIFHKHLREQAECLILGPLRMIRDDSNRSTWPKGIILDGLDEVSADQHAKALRQARTDEDDQLEILEMLLALANCPAFPFRIVIASRPERIINEFFSTTARSSAVAIFLDSRYRPDADIERFLKSKFAGIRRRSGISDESWPSQKVIDRIVEMSSGQFIIPATIVRYIESGLPRRQLEDVMRVQWDDTNTKNPFAVVDAIYTHILNRSPDPHLAVKWVLCITNLHVRTAGGGERPVPSIFWRQFLEDTEGGVQLLSYAPHLSVIHPTAQQPRCTDHDLSQILD
ncbi:hypothetical protein NMY22_g15604 [Coprinellus aureogranulatus]|nr:hypothetical protein NMY22_g15604 [Coprinellus aureogranulatus]